MLVQAGIPQGNVPSKHGAPALNILQKGVVHLCRAAFLLRGVCILVERPFQNGVPGKDACDLVPAVRVFGIRDVQDSPFGRSVVLRRLHPTVINGELLKVRQDAQLELGRPRVPAELEGRSGILLDVDGGLLRFEEELPRSSEPEAVVGRFGDPPHPDAVFVDYVLVRFGIALLVVHIPAEGLEHWIKELPAELRLVVLRRPVRLAVSLESLDQGLDF